MEDQTPNKRTASMELEPEIWKDVEGYNGRYLASNSGKIKSFAKKKEGIIKFGKINMDGYYSTSFMLNGNRKFVTVHRIIALTFIPNPNNYEVINHKDGDKLNNNDWNLEWCTTQQNTEHAVVNNLIPFGEDSVRSILTNNQVFEIRSKYIPKIYTQKMLATEYNTSRSCICHILNNRCWNKIQNGVAN